MEEPKLHYWVDEAWDWLCQQYDGVDFSDIHRYDVRWNFIEYQGLNKSPECTVHWVKYPDEIDWVNVQLIHGKGFWHTYRRKSVGIYAPTMQVDEKFDIQTQAVHEFTHFIQAMQGREFSEAETSFNEIKFAYRTNFNYFLQCKVIFDRRYNKNENIKCII